MEPENRPKRRWKTMSVRALLLLVLAIGLWLGWVVYQARCQREAVAALKKFGGFVHYDWEFVNGPVKVPPGNLIWMPSWGKFTPTKKPWAPNWMRKALGDEYFQSIAHVSLYVDIKKQFADATWVNMGPADDALEKLSTQKSVRTLQIGGQQVTDENLAYVGQMSGLEELSISWGFHLKDKGLRQLSGLKRLRVLEVDQSETTDASLEAIGKLTNLEELRLGGQGFSDQGLAHLEGLTHLRVLWLEHRKPQTKDANLESLARLKDLKELDLIGWRLTDRAMANLRGLKRLKVVRLGIPNEDAERRKRLEAILPGVRIE
jgi:hypothetical protein